MKSPHPAWIVAGVAFAAATVWINYQVKVLMVPPGALDTRGQKTLTLAVGHPAPDFSVRDLSSATVRLSDFRGKKAVLVDFWATWCGPCRMAMPSLQTVADDFRGRDIEFLSVDEGEPADQVSAFAAQEKYSFHFVLDPDSSVGSRYGLQGIPTQLLVDKQGIVRWLRVGYSPQNADLKQMAGILAREGAK
jgi:thiol-disulfide isomerase/thioredoxin